MPVDGSGSTVWGERDNIIEDLDAIINSLSDKDQIQLAFYEDNNSTSYRSHGNTENSAPTTVMMNKEKAVKLINRVKELIAENHNYVWKTAVNELNLRDKTAEAGKPYADIFEASRDKSLTPVIIQLTDGWTDQEDIDHEFAKWAKTNAVTKDLPIVDGKVVFKEKLEDGTYKIEYIATGNGVLKAEVSVNGKVVDTKTDKLNSQDGQTKVETRIVKESVEEIIGVGTVGYEVVKEIKEINSDYKLDYSDAHEYGRVHGDTGYGKKKVEISKKYKTIKGVRTGEPIEVTERVIEDTEDTKKLGTHDTYVVTETETNKREVEYIDDETMEAGTTNKVVTD